MQTVLIITELENTRGILEKRFAQGQTSAIIFLPMDNCYGKKGYIDFPMKEKCRSMEAWPNEDRIKKRRPRTPITDRQ